MSARKPTIKAAKSKLEGLLMKAQVEVGVADMALRNANDALKHENADIYMAGLCAHKAVIELQTAVSFLRRKS